MCSVGPKILDGVSTPAFSSLVSLKMRRTLFFRFLTEGGVLDLRVLKVPRVGT